MAWQLQLAVLCHIWIHFKIIYGSLQDSTLFIDGPCQLYSIAFNLETTYSIHLCFENSIRSRMLKYSYMPWITEDLKV